MKAGQKVILLLCRRDSPVKYGTQWRTKVPVVNADVLSNVGDIKVGFLKTQN